MKRRFLIFERPDGSNSWTQTLNRGTSPCHGYSTKEIADRTLEQQRVANPQWQYIVRFVFLPD